MATQISGRPAAPPAGANGSRPLQRMNGSANAGLASTKRSVPMAVAGAMAVAVGAMVALALYVSVDRRQTVLAVQRTVAPGAVIAAEDLMQVRVSPAAGITPIPVSRSATVVGKTAAVALVPGTLVVAGQLGSPATLQAGQALVGLALKPGQAPAGLKAGTRVEVIDTTRTASATDQPKPIVLTSAAVVAPVDNGDKTAANGTKTAANGTTLVSLTLPAADAPAVAAAAMDGRVSLVVLPGTP